MALKLSKRAERISQAEIRVMSIECMGPPGGWAVCRRLPTSRPSFMSG